jgi:site-specific DNA-methyltransferase (adenine-specific)
LEINKIYLMDVIDFLNKLDDGSVDLAVIDPPYNQNIGEWDRFRDDKDYFDFTFKWIELLLAKLKKTGSFYIFNNPLNSVIISNYLLQKGYVFKNWIIWNKKDGFHPTKSRFVNNQEVILFYTKSDNYTFNYEDVRIPYESKERMKHAENKGILKNGKRWYPNPKGKLCPDVWDFSSNRHKDKINGKVIKSLHPTPKPEDMIARIIKASSNVGDLILDLFSGTGTTSFVSKINGRNFVGCENNKDYFDYICERLR